MLMLRRRARDRKLNRNHASVLESELHRYAFTLYKRRAHAIEHEMRSTWREREVPVRGNVDRTHHPHAHDRAIHAHLMQIDAIAM